jgi:uncharacterized protein YjbI with pentapeptide repeats
VHRPGACKGQHKQKGARVSASRDRGLAVVVSALAALLLCACGSGAGDGARPPTPPAGGDTLHLPLLQSGDRLYENVRLALHADGSVRVLQPGAPSGSSAAPDAVLQPALDPSQLADANTHAHLAVRRMHIGSAVYRAAEIELSQGRWRYLSRTQPSTALVGEDFRLNPTLAATHDHRLVLHSAPGVSSTARIALENRAYRFCMPAQAEGADEITIVAPGGAVLVRLRAGDDCVSVTPRAAIYELRHSYGGQGSSRLVFFGRDPAQPHASLRQAAARPPWRAVAGSSEQWALYAVWNQADGTSGGGFLTAGGLVTPSATFARIGGYVQANGGGGSANVQGGGMPLPMANPAAASALFDALNFWQVNFDASGNATTVGSVFACSSCVVAPLGNGGTPVVATPAFFVSSMVPFAIQPQASGSDRWRLQMPGADGNAHSLGFPNGPTLRASWFTWEGSGVVQPASALDGLQPVTSFAQAAVFRRMLQYRPEGLGSAELPPEGSVALFNTNDCSGPAMVFRGPGIEDPVLQVQGLPGLLPGGSLGNFAGAFKLGPLTTATVYAQPDYQGESQVLTTAGCISQAAGWGAAAWTAQSLTVASNPVQMVFDTNSCVQCNLAGVDFTPYDVSGLVLNQSDLSGAIFNGKDLSNAQMQQAQLHGTEFNQANLYQANLCGASLNALPTSAGRTTQAASLIGANLHNANLNATHLEQAIFDNANFYSDVQGACSTDCSMNGCASAHGATIAGAQFANAFMSYVDFGAARGPASFANAVLVGASFAGADLSANAGGSTSFAGAFLMGADFSHAVLTDGIFAGAFYDTTGSACWAFALPQSNVQFPSVPTMTITSPGTAGASYSCGTSTGQTTGTCVAVTYQPSANAQPAALAGALLPAASSSSSNCAAAPPVCAVSVTQATGSQGYANQCWGPVPPLPSGAPGRSSVRPSSRSRHERPRPDPA